MRRCALYLLLLLVSAQAVAQSYTHVAVGSIASNNDSSALSPGAPAGVSVGDLLLICTINRTSSGASVAAISGWTQLATSIGAAEVWGRISDGSATDTPTVDWSGSNDSAAWIDAYTGDVYTDLGTIVAHTDSANGDTDNTIVFPTLTITTDDTLVYACGKKSINGTSDDQTAVTVTPEFTRTGHFPNTGAGSNDVSGASAYWQQTTATNYDGDDWTLDGSSTVLEGQGLLVSLQSDAVSAPTITSALNCNNSLDSAGLNCTVTVDQDSTGHLVACPIDQTAPTAAQIKAGTCTGGAAADEYETTSLSATVQWSAHFTGLAAKPVYDFYFIATNAGGDSAIGNDLNQVRGTGTTAAGRAREIYELAGTLAGWAAAGNTAGAWGVTLAAGDWVEIGSQDEAGECDLTHSTDGSFTTSDAAGQTCDSTQRRVELCLVDATDGENVPDTGTTEPDDWEGCYDFVYWNNNVPSCEMGDDIGISTGEAYTADFTSRWSDADLDAPTLIVASGTTCSGLSHSGTGSMTYSGTCADMDENEMGVAIQRDIYDEAGDSCSITDTEFYINTTAMPNVIGNNLFAATDTLEGAPHFYSVTQGFGCQRAQASEDIFAQSEAAMTELEIGAAVSLTANLDGICRYIERRREIERSRLLP